MLGGRSSSKTRKKSNLVDSVTEITEQLNSNSFAISSNGLLSIPRIHVDKSSASESSWTSNEDQNKSLTEQNVDTRKSSVSSNVSNLSNVSANSGNGLSVVRSNRPSRSSDASALSDTSTSSKSNRKYWGEETTDESVYNVYLKKITYSGNLEPSPGFGDLLGPNGHSDVVDSGPKSFSKDVFRRKSVGKSSPKKKSTSEEPRSISPNSRPNNGFEPKPMQSLLWETRQIRVLKAATLDHILKYILLSTPHQLEQQSPSGSKNCNAAIVEEERNNVAHVMHVLFCCFRSYATPLDLFMALRAIADNSKQAAKQFNYVLHYWLNNYPDDFFAIPSKLKNSRASSSSALHSSKLSSKSSSSKSSSSSNDSGNNRRVIDELLNLDIIDDSLFRRAAQLSSEYKPDNSNDTEMANGQSTYSKGASSSVLELDARFVAQQLTAIDLENFLSLNPYTLLEGTRSNPKVQATVKNFNLLSRHVIVTILKAQSPDIVTSHWIEIALQLRRMKNFNSLKAVIAGLTNESVYRLKIIVWGKLSRQTTSNFKWLSTIVDDVNNQTLLRQTQLEIEGTAKVSLQEESFGTIPYLGTFFTDLTVIDSQFANSTELSNGTKLINIDKWSKQFEIITQITLLQKNVRAALTAVHQSQNLSGMSQLPTSNSTPIVPRVARLFRNWFQDNNITTLNDNDCYKLSLTLEPPTPKK